VHENAGLPRRWSRPIEPVRRYFSMSMNNVLNPYDLVALDGQDGGAEDR
jgi:hypothetical protein